MTELDSVVQVYAKELVWHDDALPSGCNILVSDREELPSSHCDQGEMTLRMNETDRRVHPCN